MADKVEADVIVKKAYIKGEAVIGKAVKIDDDSNTIIASFDRGVLEDTFRNTNIGKLFVDISYDDEVTWEELGGITFGGGRVRTPLDNLPPFSQFIAQNVKPEQEDKDGNIVQRSSRVRFEALEGLPEAKVDLDLVKKEKLKLA